MRPAHMTANLSPAGNQRDDRYDREIDEQRRMLVQPSRPVSSTTHPADGSRSLAGEAIYGPPNAENNGLYHLGDQPGHCHAAIASA